MGGIFHINVVRALRAELTTMPIQIMSAALDGEPYERCAFHENAALVFGSEARGIHRDILASSVRISIPMLNIDSLNVNVAAGILMFEWRRRFPHFRI